MVTIEIRNLVEAKKHFSQYILDQEYLSHSKTWAILLSESGLAQTITKLYG